MNFLTILSYILAVVETCALIGSLICVTRALQERKLTRTKRGKKGAKSSELSRKTIAGYYRNAGIFLAVYLILNVLRRHSGLFG